MSVLVEEKSAAREIKTPKGRERWRYTLEHLIADTEGEKAEKHVPGFGGFYADRITGEHVEKWKSGIGELITAGGLFTEYREGCLSILPVIMKSEKRRLQLSILATEDVGHFDTSEQARQLHARGTELARTRGGSGLPRDAARALPTADGRQLLLQADDN